MNKSGIFHIKKNPPRYTADYIHEMTERGFAEDHKTNLRGIGRSVKDRAEDGALQGKGWMRMKGYCRRCEHFDRKKEKATDGSHCRLRRCRQTEKFFDET